MNWISFKRSDRGRDGEKKGGVGRGREKLSTGINAVLDATFDCVERHGPISLADWTGISTGEVQPHMLH